MDFLLDKKILSQLGNHILTEKEIFEYISDLIDYMEVNEYLNAVYFNNAPIKNSYGVYNFVKKAIYLNINNIIKFSFKNIKTLRIKENSTLYINLNILLNVFHEFNHACQNDLMHSLNNPVTDEFYKELLLLNDRDDVYDEYHDLFTFERNSISVSYDNILQLFLKYYSDQYMYLCFSEIYKQFLMFGYDKTSPIEILYKDFFHEEYKDILLLDDFNRIKLGYPISSEFKSNNFDSLDRLLTKKI